MGRLRNFNKIKFKPFMIRKGNIMVTNYYLNEKGQKQSLQSHLGGPKYGFWEIVRIEQNPYYGKEEEYRQKGYEDSFGGDFLRKDGYSIQKTFFNKPESHYMIACWENIDHDEKTPDLRFVGNRPFDLDVEDQRTFMILAKVGQEELMNQLREFNEDDYDYEN
jgi:hypothetical protein